MLRYSEALRNARLNEIALAIGSGAKLRLFSGAMPARCDSADPPTLLAEIDLGPQPFLPAVAGRLVSSHEPWRGIGVRRAKDEGTVAGCFRIVDWTGRCRVQGDVGVEDWADLVLSDCRIHAGQPIVIDNFKLVES
jgi:hypothetical protein